MTPRRPARGSTPGTPSGQSAAPWPPGPLVIPALKYEGAIQVAVIASAVLGVAALWTLVPARRVVAIAASVLALAACVLFRPQPPM